MSSGFRYPSAREIELHAPWMRRLARGLVGESDADELVHEAWLRLDEAREPSRSRAGYLAAVVRTLALKRRRGERRRARREALVARDEALPSAAEVAARVEIARRVAEELERLSEPYRTTLVLRYYDGLSSAEIARRAGIPAGTVRARLKRGLDALRARLDERSGDRTSWVSALLPLARSELGAPGALALPFTTLFAMKLALGIVVALALVASVWIFATREGALDAPGPERSVAVERGAQPTAGDAGAQGSSAGAAELARSLAAPAEGGEASDPSATPAPDGLELRARGVTVGRTGISGAWLQLRIDPRERAVGDASGWIALELSSERIARLQREGRASSLDVLVGAPGYATRRVPAKLVPEAHEGELGEVVLRAGASLAGRVVGEDGIGIEGALVAFGAPSSAPPGDPATARRGPPDLEPDPWSSDEPALVVESGAGGAFTLEGLRVGYGTCWARTDDGLWSWSEPIGLHAGELAGGVELVVRRDPDAVIAGLVIDPDGAPVPFASMTFRPSEADSWWTASTDARGRFHFVPPEGEAEDVAVVSPSAEWENLARKGVEPGTRDLVLAFERSRWLRIEARDGDGAPLRNGRAVGVPAEGSTDWPIPRCEGAFDGAGSARLRRPDAPLRVRVESPGYRDALLGPFELDAFPDPLVVNLERVPAITGRVLRSNGTPAAGARVSLHRAAGGGGGVRAPGVRASDALRHLTHQGWSGDRDAFVYALSAQPMAEVEADADGRFLLPMPGVDARAPNEVDGEQPSFGFGLSDSAPLSRRLASSKPETRWFVQAVAEGEASLARGPLELDPARDLALELRLPESGSIAGRLELHGEASPLGWTLRACDGMARLVEAKAAADGSFRFEHLHSGGWQVRAFEPSASFYPGGNMVTERVPEPDVEVVAGRAVEYVHETRERAAAHLSGRIEIDGAPAGAWRVEVTTRTPQAAYESRTAALDPDGRFEVALRPELETTLVASGTWRGARFRLSTSPRVVAGENDGSCEISTATLEGSVDPARLPDSPRLRKLRYRATQGEITIEVELELDGAGRFGPIAVPAGAGVLLGPPTDFLKPAPTWAELALAPGEERALDLR